jgi:hypothetical protein
MKAIVIGDIHGRTNWEELIEADALNIFVGDYFDPYENIPFAKQADNFRKILGYKSAAPDNFILLYGNHDAHYFVPNERSSRYDYDNAEVIANIFAENKGLMHGIAYAPDDKHLVSHAGVTAEWAARVLKGIGAESRPKAIADAVNALWEKDKRAFTFMYNCNDRWDCYGTSETHSPIWVRDETLDMHAINRESDWKQIVGHTQRGCVMVDEHCVFVDCLGYATQAYEFEIECLTENTDSDGKDNK